MQRYGMAQYTLLRVLMGECTRPYGERASIVRNLFGSSCTKPRAIVFRAKINVVFPHPQNYQTNARWQSVYFLRRFQSPHYAQPRRGVRCFHESSLTDTSVTSKGAE